MTTPVSRFVNLREAETEREQPVLLAYRPGAREIKAFTQPQHGLEPPDRSSSRVKGLKAADPRHWPLDPKMIALDPLQQGMMMVKTIGRIRLAFLVKRKSIRQIVCELRISGQPVRKASAGRHCSAFPERRSQFISARRISQ